jgi:hypothetical protein
MSLPKFIFYSLIAYFVIRFVARIFFAPQQNRAQNQSHSEPKRKTPDNLEKPKYTIEAEAVDYEIIDEPKTKNEE